MHPFVRNLYKRVLHVGHDYPTGIDHVKQAWKNALRNTQNCPSCYNKDGSPLESLSSLTGDTSQLSGDCHEELLRAVYRGRRMVKEMVGVIQLKKYRTMKQRYGTSGSPGSSSSSGALKAAMERVEDSAAVMNKKSD